MSWNVCGYLSTIFLAIILNAFDGIKSCKFLISEITLFTTACIIYLLRYPNSNSFSTAGSKVFQGIQKFVQISSLFDCLLICDTFVGDEIYDGFDKTDKADSLKLKVKETVSQDAVLCNSVLR